MAGNTQHAIVLYHGEAPPEMCLGLMDLARLSGCHPALLERLVDCGVVEPTHQVAGCHRFQLAALRRLLRGLRLRRDLGVSLASLPLVLDLLEELHELRARVRAQD